MGSTTQIEIWKGIDHIEHSSYCRCAISIARRSTCMSLNGFNNLGRQTQVAAFRFKPMPPSVIWL
jgi:hypothetical protein